MVVTFHCVLRGCISASLGDFLESADAEHDGDTHKVGDRTRVDQQQAACDDNKTKRQFHMVKGIASESRGNAEDADEGGADDLYALQRACEIDQQKGRIQTEAIDVYKRQAQSICTTGRRITVSIPPRQRR